MTWVRGLSPRIGGLFQLLALARPPWFSEVCTWLHKSNDSVCLAVGLLSYVHCLGLWSGRYLLCIASKGTRGLASAPDQHFLTPESSHLDVLPRDLPEVCSLRFVSSWAPGRMQDAISSRNSRIYNFVNITVPVDY